MRGLEVEELHYTGLPFDGDTTMPFVNDLAVDQGARGWQVRVRAPHAPGAARDETIDGVVCPPVSLPCSS